jgi:hypothetical protein
MEAVAARWDLGAQAEAATARLLSTLETAGWHVLHDRRLPGSRANLDHVLVSPCGGALVVLDTKRWHAGRETVLLRGRVHCGTEDRAEDRHDQVEAVARYAARVAQLVGLPTAAVWPLLVVHGSRVAGGRLRASAEAWPGPVWVLSPELLVPMLAAAPDGRDAVRAARLAACVAGVLPSYGG